MAKHKQEEVTEDVEEEGKSTKATAIALFRTFPEEVQKAIDGFVKGYKNLGEYAATIMELAQKHGLVVEEVAHVIKEKMKAAGLKPPNVNTMLGITKALPEGETDEAAAKAAEEEEAGLPCISVPLKGMNKNEVIAGLNTSNVMNVYYSEEDYSFIRIEFE
jgi:hypothetical protein